MYLNRGRGPAARPVRFLALSPKLCCLALACLCGVATAQTETPQLRVQSTYWTLETGYNQGLPFLGSEDARRGELFILSFAKPERAFRYKSSPAQMVQSLLFMRTRASGYPATADTIGYRIGARYWNRMLPGTDTFIDVGWGLSYTNPRTIDLPNNLNSTPWFGVGLMHNFGGVELVIAIHYAHMSNGGTNNDNQGFNALQYTIGVKF